MLIATAATYPARSALLEDALRPVARQVDVLNVVLNEYDAVPAWMASVDNLNPILPPHDTKDTGKFFVTPGADDWFVTIDDDIAYPDDYVARSVARMEALDLPEAIGGYHGTIYNDTALSRGWTGRLLGRNIVRDRQGFAFWQALDTPLRVEQLGTGTTIMRGRLAPAYDRVADAQRFVDVRLARIACEESIPMVCLPRAADWLPRAVEDEAGSIYRTFTRSAPPALEREIRAFAFRVPDAGTSVAAGVTS